MVMVSNNSAFFLLLAAAAAEMAMMGRDGVYFLSNDKDLRGFMETSQVSLNPGQFHYNTTRPPIKP